MQKNIILLFLIFYSCSYLPDSKGDFNLINIIVSTEDKLLIEHDIVSLFSDYINTPSEEKLYVLNWVEPELFNGTLFEVELIRDKNHEWSLLIGDIYFLNKEYEKAKSTYHEIIDNSSGLNYEMARISLAYVYEAIEDYKKAIDLLKIAIESKNNFPLFQVYWSLVRCHENNKDSSNALLILREMQIKFSSAAELQKIDKKIQQLST